MKTLPFTFLVRVLIGLIVVAFLVYTPLRTKATFVPTGPNTRPGPPSTSGAELDDKSFDTGTSQASVAANTPLNPGAYHCDFEINQVTGTEQVTFEFTRAMPKGGWLAKMTSRYPNGRVVNRNVQLFNPQTLPTGKQCSFQTTDGKLQCKIVALNGKLEFSFGRCTNKLEQYCIAESVIKHAQTIVPECQAECSGPPSYENALCMGRCLGRLASATADELDCSKHRFRCFAMRFLTWLALRGRPDSRTLAGLDEMYRNWVNFVQREINIGPPGGSCAGYGYLCPGGTTCKGNSCGLAYPSKK